MLKLFITNTSPFVRQCRIVVREHGIEGSVAEIQISADPYTDQQYLAANPGAHGPALVHATGSLIGPVEICRFLNGIGNAADLGGNGPAERLAVTERLALAQAATEFAVQLMHEQKRLAAERSEVWMGRWRDGLNRVLDRLAFQNIDAAPLNLGTIAAVVVLTYMDFRLPAMEWRNNRPRLAAAQTKFEQRESFKTTYPGVS